MNYITPTPYQPVKNTDFPDANLLLLQKAHFTGVDIVQGTIALNFEFCFFKKLIIQNESAIDFEDPSIHFVNCYIQELEVHQIEDAKISIALSSCVLSSGKLTTPKLDFFQLNNCVIKQGLFTTNVPNIRISYTTENIFPFWWNQIFKKLRRDFDWFTEGEQRYHFENPKQLVITSSKKESDRSGYYKIDHNTEKIYRLGYKLSERRENRIKASVFVRYDGESDESTLIENVGLKSLSLTGNPKGKVAIERLKVSYFYLSEFSPKSEAGFYDINPKLPAEEETKISIHKCNLDHVWFDNVDFENFQRLSFYRSKFANAVFTSCTFPNSYAQFANFMAIANIHYPDDRAKNDAKDLYEIFLQLKKAMDATGNNYESLKMQAVSQSALRNIKSISSGDKFILWTGSTFNDHGQSIGKPFCWFIVVSITGYLVYLLTIGRLFQRTPIDFNLIGSYFSFIDLTHKADFLAAKAKMTGWVFAADAISKLFMGYLIFQFVVAFRKYTRK